MASYDVEWYSNGGSMQDKVILTDCDGVLLDWEYAFDRWMARHGYTIKVNGVYKMDVKYGIERTESKKLVRMFNESASIRKIPPLRDAIKYVKKLHEEYGYVFHAITSQTNDEYAQHLRIKNLCELFGPSTFEKYVILDCGADKDEALSDYKDTNCFWIEDKVENALVGESLGLRSILMAHGFNEDSNEWADSDIIRVQCWRELYDVITGY